MATVNGLGEDSPDHLAYLLHAATRRMRAEAQAEAPSEMTQLHAAQARLLDLIPEQGARITDLSHRLRISKQGLGQLITQLSDGGFVRVSRDPADRRARLIHRTSRGDELCQQMRELLTCVEDRWQEEVGSERYLTFRMVLRQLASTEGLESGIDRQRS